MLLKLYGRSLFGLLFQRALLSFACFAPHHISKQFGFYCKLNYFTYPWIKSTEGKGDKNLNLHWRLLISILGESKYSRDMKSGQKRLDFKCWDQGYNYSPAIWKMDHSVIKWPCHSNTGQKVRYFEDLLSKMTVNMIQIPLFLSAILVTVTQSFM